MPTNIQSMLDQAIHLHEQRRWIEAEAVYLEILTIAPDQHEALHLLGVVRHQQGDSLAGMELIRRAISMIDPSSLFSMFDEIAANGTSRTIAAEQSIPRPEVARYWSNLGEIYRSQVQLDLAEKCFQQALFHDRRLADAWSNLGLTYDQLQRWQESVSACEQALTLAPNHLAAHFTLANSLKGLGQLDEAIATYHRLLATDPTNGAIYNNLGACYRSQGDLDNALHAFQRAVEYSAGDPEVYSNWLMTSLYDPDIEASQLEERHAQFGEIFERQDEKQLPTNRSRPSSRKLRVGYVSPDFRRHAVSSFFASFFGYQNRSEIETFLYSFVAHPDDVTRRLASQAHGWRDMADCDNTSVLRQIRDDEIDILIDLAGHSAGNRLSVFAAKTTRVQASYLGYPHSTGLRAIDYQIVDSILEPFTEDEQDHLIRIDPCSCCFHPTYATPDPNPLPALRQGYITFGSLHPLVRLNDRVIACWARILKEVRDSKLLIFRDSLTPASVSRLQAKFMVHGIANERLLMFNRLQHLETHFSVYHHIDICLDTFPWSGHTTCVEAMWMGVPSITLQGDRRSSRMISSVLNAVGLTAWSASTVDAYVEKATGLAEDTSELQSKRERLRSMMLQSPLCDGPGFAKRFDAMLVQLYREL